ncbi:MAG: Crp/Fnr family transcriptional regulator [Gammaproteobacteria bacterium]|nr:Crp/Fnr family transcriptional regulator [Gammaproteobacteria bacterium]
MFDIKQNNDNAESGEAKLIEIYKKLPDSEREKLISFAEFTAANCDPRDIQVEKPVFVERPEDESVVAGIKRLSAVYHMVDRSKILHETSALMAEHMMQGRAAAEVIDDVEALFERTYEKQFGVPARETIEES